MIGKLIGFIELDMKDKEWSKYGKDVMDLVKKMRDQGLTKDVRTLVIVCGFPGSGREEFVNKLNWETVENLGDVKNKMCKNNVKLVVNTPNLTAEERKKW